MRFVRSDVPTDVSEDERQWLLANDVSVIVDLRTEVEREKKECPLEKDNRFKYYCKPVTGGNAIPPSVDDVSKSYIGMVDENLYNTIYFILNAKSNILYFCNAGKDRTGVVSAILLLKMGFSKEYIINDYMKSRENLKDMLDTFAKCNTSVDVNIITPQERYMEEFLLWFVKNGEDFEVDGEKI